MRLEFPDEIKDRVFDMIAEEWLPEDHDYNLTVGVHDELTINLVMSDGTQVWVIRQYDNNKQALATFLMDGEGMICADFPTEVMEVANLLRNFNAEDKLKFVWDYINTEEE